MEFDIFFSISQTPDHNGHTPTESEMFANYFAQLEAADRLGFGVAWIAQAHLSTETQQQNTNPVVPHWKGELAFALIFVNSPWNPSEGQIELMLVRLWSVF